MLINEVMPDPPERNLVVFKIKMFQLYSDWKTPFRFGIMKPTMWGSRTGVDGYPFIAGKTAVIRDFGAVLLTIWEELYIRLVTLTLQTSVQL